MQNQARKHSDPGSGRECRATKFLSAGRSFSRRRFLRHAVQGAAGGAAAGWIVPASTAADESTEARSGERPTFRYCLNTGTVRGHKKSLDVVVEVCARAGYNAIEPWVGEIDEFQQGGGKLEDLRRRLEDHGMQVESSIAFAPWMVDDENRRREAFEQMRREMDLVRRIGGRRIAAPPAGVTREENFDLMRAAARYHELLELGREMGVTPQLELWGFSRVLSRLGELAMVAVESGHPHACLLPDVFHIYKGGSDFTGLNLFSGHAIHVFHLNDYPADPPRETIGDADRVYPGDGVAPIGRILRILAANRFSGVLSLELFNRTYWAREIEEVVTTGLAKMKAAVENALDLSSE